MSRNARGDDDTRPDTTREEWRAHAAARHDATDRERAERAGTEGGSHTSREWARDAHRADAPDADRNARGGMGSSHGIERSPEAWRAGDRDRARGTTKKDRDATREHRRGLAARRKPS